MDKLLLKLLKLFGPMLARAGANPQQLFQIVEIKLLIDRRKPKPGIFGKSFKDEATKKAKKKPEKKKKEPTVESSWFTDVLGMFFGTFMGCILFIGDAPLIGQSFYLTVYMVMIAFTLISDFSTTLFDTRDQYILLPRPVDDRTLTLSRIFHITIYIVRFGLILGVPAAIIAGFLEHSVLAGILFLVQTFLATLLCVLLVNTIYLAMARAVNPQKFKNIITYFQIAFSILIFGVYYLLPRLIDVSALAKIALLSNWWAYLLPPVWLASINEAILHVGRSGIAATLLALVGFLVPIAGLWLVVKVLAPGFNRRLVVLATSDGYVAPSTTNKVYKTDFRDKLASVFCRNPLEVAGYRFTWKMAARTRDFKMRVYPTFAYVPFYFVYMVLQGHGSLAEKFEKMQNRSYYVILVYLSATIITQLLSYISYSDKYKSAWVFSAAPMAAPGKILSGMLKALLTLYFIPYTIVLGSAAVAIWGPKVINDVILGTLISTIYAVLSALFTVKGMPFSQPVLNKNAGGKFLKTMLTFVFVGVLAVGHYFLRKFEIVIWIAIIPFAVIVWLMMHYYSKQDWESIDLAEV